jgi:glycosyltransferase involved in cell wall biosynthesis
MLVSIIVTTYNWPAALNACLRALAEQSYTQSYEIIVADDGSQPETKNLILDLQPEYPVPLIHVWQPDDGFRAAAIRNQAILKSRGAYIIFIDGDCIPPPTFIRNHVALAAPNKFVVGHRLLLSAELTHTILTQQLPSHRWSFIRWLGLRVLNQCNRILPLIRLPNKGPWRDWRTTQWKGAKGCNLGIWKSDLIQVNGWEEQFSGWGYEYSDLIIRLIHLGVKRRSGHGAVPAFHLWHAEHDRSRALMNESLLYSRFQTPTCVLAERGLQQYVEFKTVSF